MDLDVKSKRFERFRRPSVARRKTLWSCPPYKLAKGTDTQPLNFPLWVSNGNPEPFWKLRLWTNIEDKLEELLHTMPACRFAFPNPL